jgi:hypothetical protein
VDATYLAHGSEERLHCAVACAAARGRLEEDGAERDGRWVREVERSGRLHKGEGEVERDVVMSAQGRGMSVSV